MSLNNRVLSMLDNIAVCPTNVIRRDAWQSLFYIGDFPYILIYTKTQALVGFVSLPTHEYRIFHVNVPENDLQTKKFMSSLIKQKGLWSAKL